MPSPSAPRYQPSVAGIVQNCAGEILICERIAHQGAWQFPQGSLNKGEAPTAGLRRELWEEIGLPAEHYALREQHGPYRYLYGSGKRKKGYEGKEQLYFRCELLVPEVQLDLEATTPEFQALR